MTRFAPQLPSRILSLVVMLCCAVVVLQGCSRTREAAPVEIERPSAKEQRSAESVIVDVSGAVRRPGVYRLPEGARVLDAIASAGGPTAKARLETLNQAAEVVDGQQVLVPTAGAAVAVAAGGAASSAKISINTADVSQLDELPGIGPVTAQRIVEDRAANGPFTSIDDLDRVSGIGAGTIDELRSAATL